MISDSKVRDKIALLAQNKLSLVEFERWLSSASWNMHRDSSPESIELVSSIHVLLSERDDAVIQEKELRHELLKLLNSINESIVIVGYAMVRKPVAASVSVSRSNWAQGSLRVLPVPA